MRTVYVNGVFCPENQGVVSIFDRGFLFAEGRPTAADFFFLSALESFEFCYGVEHVGALLPAEFNGWRERIQARPFFSAYQSQAKPILFDSMKA